MPIIYKILSVFTLLIVSMSCYSQIGIFNETPDASAALDIVSTDKGVSLPSMTTSEKLAITSPAVSLLVYDTDLNCISQNIGTEASPVWKCLTDFGNYFFYMPSINIPTTIVGATSNIDLYQLYRDQYANPGRASTGAPTSIPYFTSASQLYYYVTYHDDTRIRINSINASGVMNYTVLKKANFDTYMNIVFVVK